MSTIAGRREGGEDFALLNAIAGGNRTREFARQAM
jgi:hypothetical protein